MSVGTLLSPEDNEALLRLCAATRRRETGAAAVAEAKRDIVLCFERRRLLLAVDAGMPLARAGPEGQLLFAFTDDEAGHAWLAAQHPAAPPCDLALSADAPPDSERAGRRDWLERFEAADAVAVVVNPAGPLTFVVHRQECDEMRPRLRRRDRGGDGDEAWLDLGARAAERARVAALMSAFADAVLTGDEEEFQRVRPELSELNRMSSALWGVERDRLSGHWRLSRGEDRLGAYQLAWAGAAYGRVAGDPYRCIDALLDSVEILTGMVERGVSDPEQPDFAGMYRRQAVDVLQRMRIGYRASDIEDVVAGIEPGGGGG